MKRDQWLETREAFARIAAQEGIDKIAGEIPAHRSAVYRLIRGETMFPKLAVRAGIERIVREHQQEQPKD
jgi:hypothetical protein